MKTWVPPVNVVRESVHGAGALKKKEPKKGLSFFAKSQKKAHIVRDELTPDDDQMEEVFLKSRVQTCQLKLIMTLTVRTAKCLMFVQTWTEMIYHLFLTSVDFFFKTQLCYCRHMQTGKHKKPVVSMKDSA